MHKSAHTNRNARTRVREGSRVLALQILSTRSFIPLVVFILLHLLCICAQAAFLGQSGVDPMKADKNCTSIFKWSLLSLFFFLHFKQSYNCPFRESGANLCVFQAYPSAITRIKILFYAATGFDLMEYFSVRDILGTKEDEGQSSYVRLGAMPIVQQTE